MERAADALKVTLQFFDVHSREEIEGAMVAMSKAGVQAVVISETPALNVNTARIGHSSLDAEPIRRTASAYLRRNVARNTRAGARFRSMPQKIGGYLANNA